MDSQDDETDANGVIPTVKESRLVPDLPPVTIRQEPISPVKVRYYNSFNCRFTCTTTEETQDQPGIRSLTQIWWLCCVGCLT